jgi:hypothetical protein
MVRIKFYATVGQLCRVVGYFTTLHQLHDLFEGKTAAPVYKTEINDHGNQLR